MDGAGVITFNIFTFQTPAFYQDYEKWASAAYGPMLNSTGVRIGSESCSPLDDRSIYREAHIVYLKDFENYYSFTNTPEFDAYWKDIFTTWKEKFDISWQSVYYVIKRFKSTQAVPVDKGRIIDKTTYLKEFAGGDAPVVLVKGLDLYPETWEKYEAWVKEWGNEVYFPLLLKVTGVTEVCRCWLSNLRRENALLKPGAMINPDYPSDLSLIYFANLKAYQGFLRSKELAAYEKNLALAFPGSLVYKWDKAFKVLSRTSK